MTDVVRSDDVELDRLKMILFGKPGAGKTHMYGTLLDAPDVFMPALLLDFESGAIPLKGKFATVPVKDIVANAIEAPKNLLTRVRIRTWSELDEIQDSLHEQERNGELQFQTVGLDSLSEVAYMTLTGIVASDLKDRPKRDPEVPEQGDYQRQGLRLRKLIRDYRDLNVHALFSCLAMESVTPRGITEWRPALTQKLALETPGLVHALGFLVIVQLDDGSMIREIIFQQDTQTFVKSRYAKFLPSVPEPSYPKLYQLMTEEGA